MAQETAPVSPSSLAQTLPGNKDLSLDQAQVLSALKALKKYHRRHAKKLQKSHRSLFETTTDPETTNTSSASKDTRISSAIAADDNPIISIQFSLKRIPRKSPHKGVFIPLPHPLWKSAEVCLITKDEAVEVVEEDVRPYCNHTNNTCSIPGVGSLKIMGIRYVKTEYGTHERRRQLLQMYDVFLVDDRLLPMMPRILGNAFFKRKEKLPRAIDLNVKDVGKEVEKVVGGVVGRWGKGTCVEVAIGRMNWKTSMVVENLKRIVEKCVPRFDGGWSGVLSAGIKSRDLKGLCLQVWNSLPQVADYEYPEPKGDTTGNAAKKQSDSRKRGVNKKEQTGNIKESSADVDAAEDEDALSEQNESEDEQEDEQENEGKKEEEILSVADKTDSGQGTKKNEREKNEEQSNEQSEIPKKRKAPGTTSTSKKSTLPAKKKKFSPRNAVKRGKRRSST